VASDGSINLQPAQNSYVEVLGELVVNGRAVTADILAAQSLAVTANHMFLFFADSFRFETFALSTPGGSVAFTFGGVFYVAIGSAANENQLYAWNNATGTYSSVTFPPKSTAFSDFAYFFTPTDVLLLAQPSSSAFPAAAYSFNSGWSLAGTLFTGGNSLSGNGYRVKSWAYPANNTVFAAQGTAAGTSVSGE
jgi:hypothetical protein